MKKIMGVAVAASLVASMAFADVAVGLNARLRGNAFHMISTDKSATAKEKTEFHTLDLDGAKTHGGSGTFSDTLSFNGKTSDGKAGVQLEMAPVGGATNTVAVDKKYNLWMTFGGLKLSAGTFDSRFINRYNVTAAESGLLDSDDIAKYGTALLSSVTAVAKDANNVTAYQGTRKTVLIADYTVAGVMLKGGFMTGKDPFATTTDEDGNITTQHAGYLMEADFKAGDAANVQVLGKLMQTRNAGVARKEAVFGAYADIKKLPVNLALGFTYGMDEVALATAGLDASVMVFDARVGKKVNDKLNIATVAKYEMVSYKEHKDVTATEPDTDTALTLAAEVSYIVNDTVTAGLDAGIYMKDLDGSDKSRVYKENNKVNCIKVRPFVRLAAQKNCAVTAAFQYDSYMGYKSSTGCTQSEWSVPVIIRVKF